MKDPAFIEEMIAKGKKAGSLIHTEFGSLPDSAFASNPAEGGWSIAQCIDHIIVSDSLYFPSFKKIKKGEYKMNIVEKWSPMSRFFGKMMEHYISEKVHRKIKSPRQFLPATENPGKDILFKYETHHTQLLAYLEDFGTVDIDKLIIRSRISGLVTYSLRTAISIIIHHQFRHIHQAIRVKKKITIS